jgi:hypothetical protein
VYSRHVRELCAVLAAISSAAVAPSSSAEDAVPVSVVADYSYEGGLGQGPAEVHVRGDGVVTVQVTIRNTPPRPPKVTEEYRLSAEEAGVLVDLVKKVDFFGESAESEMVTCTGWTTLKIAHAGKTRESKWIHKPNMHPLTAWFQRFVRQAGLLAELREGEGIRRIDDALDPRGLEVAQRSAFRQPLREFIERTSDDETALVALGALARVEEADRWGALASRRAAAVAEAGRFAFVQGLVNTEQATPEQRATLLPDVLAVVRPRARTWEDLDSWQKDRTSSLIWFLANHRYEPTLSALQEMAREAPTPRTAFSSIHFPLGAMACWGTRGLDAATSLLSAREPGARMSAIRGLEGFLYERWKPQERVGPSDAERSKVRERLASVVIPKLNSMAEDPTEDSRVRDLAKDQIAMLRKVR